MAASAADIRGHVLVADDNAVNRRLLARAVTQQGFQVTTAQNGREALALLLSTESGTFDVILLDILMPEMDGYQVLAQVKGDERLHHVPVIMISALDEMDSVVRCIEMGATDYLPKPVDPALLKARLNTSLAAKRLRDLELEYLEQVGRVVDAAKAVESASFDPAMLDQVAAREDALGSLARVFQRMAREVYLREQRLKQQLAQLRLDVEEMKQALVEPLSVYLAMDRQHALARGEALPDRTTGSALFADVSGFTALSAALEAELGGERGAEEMARIMTQVFSALVDEVHRYKGSVIGFAGDAITCWFEEKDEGRGRKDEAESSSTLNLPPSAFRAVACALAMQKAMALRTSMTTPQGKSRSLAMKVGVASGPARRFIVGDPAILHYDTLAGTTLTRMGAAEHLAAKGDVVVDARTATLLGDRLEVSEWPVDHVSGLHFAKVDRLREEMPPVPWPSLPPDALSAEQVRPWTPSAVYEQIRSGNKQFLSELRPASVAFVNFRGIDYDRDENAGAKLDAYVRWVQAVIQKYEGTLLELTIGDKGSYLFMVFGAPLAHEDDAFRAVCAAQELCALPPDLSFISGIRIGLAQGQMRAGAYGSTTRRTYVVKSDKVNLAAKLMMAATGRHPL